MDVYSQLGYVDMIIYPFYLICTDKIFLQLTSSYVYYIAFPARIADIYLQ